MTDLKQIDHLVTGKNVFVIQNLTNDNKKVTINLSQFSKDLFEENSYLQSTSSNLIITSKSIQSCFTDSITDCTFAQTTSEPLSLDTNANYDLYINSKKVFTNEPFKVIYDSYLNNAENLRIKEQKIQGITYYSFNSISPTLLRVKLITRTTNGIVVPNFNNNKNLKLVNNTQLSFCLLPDTCANGIQEASVNLINPNQPFYILIDDVEYSFNNVSDFISTDKLPSNLITYVMSECIGYPVEEGVITFNKKMFDNMSQKDIINFQNLLEDKDLFKQYFIPYTIDTAIAGVPKRYAPRYSCSTYLYIRNPESDVINSKLIRLYNKEVVTEEDWLNYDYIIFTTSKKYDYYHTGTAYIVNTTPDSKEVYSVFTTNIPDSDKDIIIDHSKESKYVFESNQKMAFILENVQVTLNTYNQNQISFTADLADKSNYGNWYPSLNLPYERVFDFKLLYNGKEYLPFDSDSDFKNLDTFRFRLSINFKGLDKIQYISKEYVYNSSTGTSTIDDSTKEIFINKINFK